jgi:hypothetical protein
MRMAAVKPMEGSEMSIDWQNGAPDRGRTSLPESFKPKELRLATAAESYAAAAPVAPVRPVVVAQPATDQPVPMLPTEFTEDAEPKAPVPPIVDLRKLEAQLGRKRLDEIADFVRALTYGEMIELAESMWSVRPDDSELNAHNLPAVLYRWSTSRKS